MRYSVDIYETATGQFVRSTPWHLGTAYYDQYTVLFFMHFKHTDHAFLRSLHPLRRSGLRIVEGLRDQLTLQY
ncbi:MAG TPA: hypothetical protein VJ692_07155 [Nitrospiraceae bacterium]|nr:hypothetical protein [Nitrospiraceae bacterium]